MKQPNTINISFQSFSHTYRRKFFYVVGRAPSYIKGSTCLDIKQPAALSRTSAETRCKIGNATLQEGTRCLKWVAGDDWEFAIPLIKDPKIYILLKDKYNTKKRSDISIKSMSINLSNIYKNKIKWRGRILYLSKFFETPRPPRQIENGELWWKVCLRTLNLKSTVRAGFDFVSATLF